MCVCVYIYRYVCMYVCVCIYWVGQKNLFRFLYSVTEKLELLGQSNIHIHTFS